MFIPRTRRLNDDVESDTRLTSANIRLVLRSFDGLRR